MTEIKINNNQVSKDPINVIAREIARENQAIIEKATKQPKAEKKDTSFSSSSMSLDSKKGPQSGIYYALYAIMHMVHSINNMQTAAASMLETLSSQLKSISNKKNEVLDEDYEKEVHADKDHKSQYATLFQKDLTTYTTYETDMQSQVQNFTQFTQDLSQSGSNDVTNAQSLLDIMTTLSRVMA